MVTLDIAAAIRSRSNCALGFLSHHRVLSLMKGLCRTANSCKAGFILGALRIPCNGLCTAVQVPFLLSENLGYLLGCGEGLDCLRHYNRCPTLFRSLLAIWLGTGDCISPTAICNDQLFKIAFPSERVCSLVSGVLDASVTPFNLQRTHQGQGHFP